MEGEPTKYRIDDPGIRILFSEESRIQSWLDVEVALAEAQADLEIIPRTAAKEIKNKAKFENLNMGNIHEGLVKTGHSLVPTIWELDRLCENNLGGYVHWGATTQNITQTGKLLQVKKAHGIFLKQMAELLAILGKLAYRTKDMPLPGRTHGQHAVPATYGYKVSVWIDELCRHVDRMQACERRVFLAMLGGGAGTLASLGHIGLEVQSHMAKNLGLYPMPMPSRVIGDHIVEYVALLGMLAATSSKMAREVYTQMKDEFGEVEENVPPGTVGSSTMPQKRNPKLSREIVGAAATVRSLVPLAMEGMQTEHEADHTTEIMLEHSLEQSCIITGDILQRLVLLFEGLQVFPERMRRNLDLSGGLIMSEAIMLELGKYLGRQRAHDIVYEAAQEAFVSNMPFKDVLRNLEGISEYLGDEQIDDLLDPSSYTGVSSYFAERGAYQAKEISEKLLSKFSQ